MQIRDGLIGNDHSNCVIEFSGSDSLENFNKRLLEKDKNWYYRGANITYDLNRYGHRCKNVEDIDLDNYILFAGCSHTEGIGLEIEKSYPYLLSKKFNCDYYNLGIGGAGVDAVLHNLTVWLNRYKRPKALIMQWPFWGRYVCVNFPVDGSVRPVGPWDKDPDHVNLILVGERINYYKSVEYLSKLKIDSFGLPTVHVTPKYEPNNPAPDYCIEFYEFDQARDMHMGILSHQVLYEQIEERLLSYELKNN